MRHALPRFLCLCAAFALSLSLTASAAQIAPEADQQDRLTFFGEASLDQHPAERLRVRLNTFDWPSFQIDDFLASDLRTWWASRYLHRSDLYPVQDDGRFEFSVTPRRLKAGTQRIYLVEICVPTQDEIPPWAGDTPATPVAISQAIRADSNSRIGPLHLSPEAFRHVEVGDRYDSNLQWARGDKDGKEDLLPIWASFSIGEAPFEEPVFYRTRTHPHPDQPGMAQLTLSPLLPSTQKMTFMREFSPVLNQIQFMIRRGTSLVQDQGTFHSDIRGLRFIIAKIPEAAQLDLSEYRHRSWELRYDIQVGQEHQYNPSPDAFPVQLRQSSHGPDDLFLTYNQIEAHPPGLLEPRTWLQGERDQMWIDSKGTGWLVLGWTFAKHARVRLTHASGAHWQSSLTELNAGTPTILEMRETVPPSFRAASIKGLEFDPDVQSARTFDAEGRFLRDLDLDLKDENRSDGDRFEIELSHEAASMMVVTTYIDAEDEVWQFWTGEVSSTPASEVALAVRQTEASLDSPNDSFAVLAWMIPKSIEQVTAIESVRFPMIVFRNLKIRGLPPGDYALEVRGRMKLDELEIDPIGEALETYDYRVD